MQLDAEDELAQAENSPRKLSIEARHARQAIVDKLRKGLVVVCAARRGHATDHACLPACLPPVFSLTSGCVRACARQ
jgi:hypothetical protein